MNFTTHWWGIKIISTNQKESKMLSLLANTLNEPQNPSEYFERGDVEKNINNEGLVTLVFNR